MVWADAITVPRVWRDRVSYARCGGLAGLDRGCKQYWNDVLSLVLRRWRRRFPQWRDGDVHAAVPSSLHAQRDLSLRTPTPTGSGPSRDVG